MHITNTILSKNQLFPQITQKLLNLKFAIMH